MKRSAISAAILLMAALAANAQEEPLPDLFTDVLDVRLVNVEVVVTDRDGNRIQGLYASDFELLVDKTAASQRIGSAAEPSSRRTVAYDR